MIWLKQEVAKAQRELVEQELNYPWPTTFNVFVRAVEATDQKKRKTILDAGCGVGHYGIICSTAFPKLGYTGTDFSFFMLEEAKDLFPGGEFQQKEFFKNNFGDYDICYTGGTIEYTRSPWDALDYLLESAKEYIILHRLHMTEKESHFISEPAYCGLKERKMLWNDHEIRNAISNYDYKVIYEESWDQTMTLVLR